jgi:hypothetical protein
MQIAYCKLPAKLHDIITYGLQLKAYLCTSLKQEKIYPSICLQRKNVLLQGIQTSFVTNLLTGNI